MAKTAPSTALLPTGPNTSSKGDLERGSHYQHKMTRVGTFRDAVNESTVYEVFYCQNDHQLVVI